MSYQINGMQQVGIGTPHLGEAWAWYRRHFRMDVPVFREAAQAPLMAPYTGGKTQSRDAVLAINLQGGGGFEIWQYTSRESVFPEHAPTLGDTGIFAAVIKTMSIEHAHRSLSVGGCTILNEPVSAPDGTLTFHLRDPWGNIFQIVESEEWFHRGKHPTGGFFGVMMGVSDMDTSLSLYRDALGFDVIEYDKEEVFPDWNTLKGGHGRFRRILLTRSKPPSGPFAPLLGSCRIELIQSLERQAEKIFKDRYWGDCGFIHLCFDVRGMDSLKDWLSRRGFPFTVDSEDSFDMGEAAGRFAYIEDPDGTLIEFVETRKIPIMKKWGWYLDLSKHPPDKPLPWLILKALGLGRVRE